MIKQALPHFLLFIVVTLLSACDKDKPVDEPQNNLPQYLLKTITWDNGLTATSSYNSDSTLQGIDVAFQSASGKTVFMWTGKKFTEMYEDRSMYKNVFEYDHEGKVVKMRNTAKTGSSPTGYVLEFHYNGAKKVDSLNYFAINEAGKQLQASSAYHYNNAGELEEVITKSGNNTITHTINAYSPAVSFNPCHYIETTLNENYTIYNFAVMTQLNKINKLPATITRVVKTGSAPSYVDKIEAHVYSITNYRIDKVVTTMSFPGVPGNNKTIEHVYSYF
jgi:hypothetical protein